MFGRNKRETAAIVEQPNPYFEGSPPSISNRFPEKWLYKGRLNLTDEDLTLYKPFRLGFSERLKHDVHEICQWTGTDPMGKPVVVSAFVSKRWGNNNSIHIKIPSDQKDYLSGPEIATFDIGPELQDWSFDRSKGVA